MGHIRLGKLPRTRRWKEVLDLIGGGGSAAAVASATLDAADQELPSAANDPGVLRSFWLLTQLPDAARSDNFVEALRSLGLNVSDAPTTTEIVTAFTEAVDRHVDSHRARTDLGEMAQMAAVETLAKTLQERTVSLFGTTPDDVQRELGRLATEKQFGAFARDFFSRFTERFLTYHVDRELPRQVGPEGRFPSNGQRHEFSRALELHCQQASKIVESFAGGWYSKARFEKELTEPRVARFVGYALKKMRLELRRGASE
ncbi:MAG: hypothetical protein D6798_12400 [Deltaproteobacteria bacterium]|nr:MAG: hypothetical protein D6798_12400 [Deltaproteobacteria bacterium]